MRKHEEDQNTTNHDNRSLTPRMKQFKNDEMGTTRKGCSHLCFRTHLFFLFPFLGRGDQGSDDIIVGKVIKLDLC